MSLSIALSSALSGLQLNQRALEVTASNVANVNTEGYSRKTIKQTSQQTEGRGAGVRIADISRQVNRHLVRDLRAEGSTLGAVRAEGFYFGRMQDLFGAPGQDSSLSARLSGLAGQLESLAATPESATQRIAAVDAAVALTRDLNDAAGQVQTFRADANREIADSVATINRNLAEVAELNTKILEDKAVGRPIGDLEDRRDQAIAAVAEQIDISTFDRTGGETVVMTRAGRVLADTNANKLSYTPTATVDASVTYAGGGFAAIAVGGTDITGELVSGRLKALVDMRDGKMPELGSELDRLASVLKSELNAIHNDGAGFPPAATLTGTNAVSGGGAAAFSGTGTVRIAVVNADGTFAATPLDLDLSTVTTVNAVISAINTGLSGVATASLDAGNQLVVTATNAGDGIAINEGTSAVGGRGFSSFFGLNDLFVGDPSVSLARTIAVRADIVASPQLLARGELSEIAAASITTGQSLAIGAGDNRVAQRLADRFNADVSFTAAGGLPALNTNLADYGAQILARNAASSADASARLEFRNQVFQDLTFKSDSVSAVNIDEELANLQLFQNAYSASARMIRAASEMLKILEDLVG